jgi:hypothetical protein
MVELPPPSPPRRWPFVLLAVAAATIWLWHLSRDPAVVLLRPSADGARWVRVDRPFDVASHQNVATAAAFTAAVDVPRDVHGAGLEVVALGRATVWVDGRPITGDVLDLSAGRHGLRVDVTNINGPAMVRVSCPTLGLRTGTGDWRANGGRAVPADEPWEPALPPQFGPTWRDLLRLSPLLVALWAIGTVAALRRSTGADWGRRVRWAVLVGWAVLAVNNIGKVPLAIGYDVDSHYQYVRYVAERRALPPADGGWQFFQAPLFYVVSAVMERMGAGPHALRVIPLACGAAVAELCYRAARTVFPDRGDLQALAVAVGGLLPVNLYMAQVVSNEPMAAATAGLVVWATLDLLTRPAGVRSGRRLALLGAALGVAWLTKVSGLVWVVPVGGALAAAVVRLRAADAPSHRHPAPADAEDAGGTPVRRPSLAADVARLAVVPGVALAVSGWYFVRNLAQVGRPFFRESSVVALRWWQDPGYRVPSNLIEFGHVFARPVYNGLGSVWDSLYGSLWANGIPSGRPPWNYGLMAAGLWLGLIPTGLVLGGVGAAVGRRGAAGLRLAAVSVGLFIAAVVNVYLTLPIYSDGKASYLLGTAPCLAVLAAGGFDRLRPRRWPRAIVAGGVFSWAVVAYLTYFVV